MTEKQGGYSRDFVSGPRRVTKQIGAESGLLGSFTLCLYWADPEPGYGVMWVDFELFEVTATDMRAADPQYQRRGSTFSPDLTRDPGEAESAAEGFVKWDGCTQFEIGRVHVDHRDDLHKLFAAIAAAREECARAMPDADIADEYDKEAR